MEVLSRVNMKLILETVKEENYYSKYNTPNSVYNSNLTNSLIVLTFVGQHSLNATKCLYFKWHYNPKHGCHHILVQLVQGSFSVLFHQVKTYKENLSRFPFKQTMRQM